MQTKLLAQKRKHTLRQLVGLRHHGRASLLQYLCAREIGGFGGKIGILNSAA